MLCCFEKTWICNSSLYHSLVLKQHRAWTLILETKTRQHLNYIEDIFSVDGSRRAIKFNHSLTSLSMTWWHPEIQGISRHGIDVACMIHSVACTEIFFFFAISDIFVFQVIISYHCILITDHNFFFFFLTFVNRKHHQWHKSIYIIYQCQGCWWPGDWHHPDISRRSTDYNFLLIIWIQQRKVGQNEWFNISTVSQVLYSILSFFLSSQSMG